MKKISTLFIAFEILTGISFLHAQDISECIDLFIWAGQSNAQGWMGDAAYYPADPENQDSSIRLNYTYIDNTSSDGEWISMQKQEGVFSSGHFGAEVSFSRELKKAGYNPAIFKYTKGGTSIYNNWKLPGQGGMYDAMVNDLNNAISELEDEGHRVTIKGFIWIQGESDAKTSTYANAYYNNLSTLINNMRDVVTHNDQLTIVLGVDEQHPWVVERPQVLQAQEKLDNDDDNIVFTSMYGLEKADETHLTPTELVKHGERIFAAFDSTYSLKLSLPEIQIEQGDSVLVFGKYRKEAGIYRDTLVAANGCDSICIQNLVYNSETSIEQLCNEKRFTCYPNPFENTFCIEYPNIQNRITIEVIDISGRIVMQKKMGNCSIAQINTTRLKPSMYFIRVLNDEKLEVVKAIKR